MRFFLMVIVLLSAQFSYAQLNSNELGVALATELFNGFESTKNTFYFEKYDDYGGEAVRDSSHDFFRVQIKGLKPGTKFDYYSANVGSVGIPVYMYSG